ncbi:Guanyl-specific ribonuclease F1 [Metarhizium album ARSEF 1941]|uniref:ribonuclease T1 n=1 Tax=Metarhizium album (strain ARSEF 1941) TaxID=1081103 RepID=A0A0B2WVT0_METAS|nr:Guanyl-specific ribonuclease F1 [Metarhizium album ARSEF 1941]KHN97719.1 Guanyl-specific ribonuclease F1 [Metarhizium album ARSEF 1941]
MQFSVFSLISLVALASAAPADLQARDATSCGGVQYTSDDVQAAADTACDHVRSGSHAGSSTYPHRYNNYEGFDFPVSGPYDEFPILKSGAVYSGGSPGPDRVVINDDCELAGVITHTGASGNNFVGCSGTS